MVKRIREIFEEDNGTNMKEDNPLPYLTITPPPTAQKQNLLKPPVNDKITRRHSSHEGKVVPVEPTEISTGASRNIRSTTVPTANLLKLLRHYRNLCKQANVEEQSLCTELLEADEPFIGMMDMEEPSNLSVSGDALAQIRKLPGNERCADCGADDTSWASTNIGVFLCIRCSGVHRSLGVHISSVLSCSLDVWSYNFIQAISALGNERVNKEYEYHLQKNASDYLAFKLKAGSSTEERKLFIKAKYVSKQFHKSTLEPNLREYRVRKAKTSNLHVRSLSQTSLPFGDLHKKAMMEYCGIVFINLQRAVKVHKKKLNSFITHIYVSFTMGTQKVNSKKFKNVQKPKWNEALQLNLPMESESCEMLISICGYSAIRQNEPVVLAESKINVREERFLEAPQNLELSAGEGTLYLSVFVTDLNK